MKVNDLFLAIAGICLLLLCSCATAPAPAETPNAPQQKINRAAWMQEARWGVMSHFLSDWLARNENMPEMTVDKWNEIVDNFDVEGLADQLQAVGAKYYIFTLGQNSGFFVSPNKVYDELTGITPSKLAKRDLLKDIATALKARGIRTIAYLPSGAPAGDKQAREALQWQNGPYPNVEFQQKWEQIISYWSKQWGDLVSGWWFDGCYWQNAMYRNEKAPNFQSFAEAARAGNPNSAVAFNPGILYRTLSVTPHEDYIAGEVNMPELMSLRTQDGLADESQLQILTYMGDTWGTGAPRYTVDEVIGFSQHVINNKGAITWDVPIRSNGLLDARYIEPLKKIGDVLNNYEPAPERRRPVIQSWPKGVPYIQ